MEEIAKKPIFIVLLALFVFYLLNMSVSSEIVQEKLNDKNVLIELFINAECTICPKAAFCLEDLAWSYESGKVILVEEHIWGDGYDSPETNERYNWYVEGGVKGTPDIFFNGLSEHVQGLCCDCDDIEKHYLYCQSIIEKELAKTSPIDLSAEKSYFGNKIIVQGRLENISHELLKNLIVGGIIYFEGEESELFYLVKDVFDSQDIYQLAPMEEKKFNFISKIELTKNDDNDNADKYHSVIFIQDKFNKEILQSLLIK
jgi:hypothetical protein